jgi:hypothetical protein
MFVCLHQSDSVTPMEIGNLNANRTVVGSSTSSALPLIRRHGLRMHSFEETHFRHAPQKPMNPRPPPLRKHQDRKKTFLAN